MHVDLVELDNAAKFYCVRKNRLQCKREQALQCLEGLPVCLPRLGPKKDYEDAMITRGELPAESS